MPQPNDLSRSLVALDQDSTIIVVVEMSQSSWLVAGMLPRLLARLALNAGEPSAERLLGLLHRWRDEAVKAGRKITRIAHADLEPGVCADPMLIGMAQNLGRPRRQWSSTPLYRGI
jgi:hypothetical protein